MAVRPFIPMAVVVALMATPARAQTPAPAADEHAGHHPAPTAQQAPRVDTPAVKPAEQAANGPSADARLTALVQKMRAATGDAKIDAMGELLAALVEKQQAPKCAMMQEMKDKMDKTK